MIAIGHLDPIIDTTPYHYTAAGLYSVRSCSTVVPLIDVIRFLSLLIDSFGFAQGFVLGTG